MKKGRRKEGEIKVTLERNPKKMVTYQDKYDWELKIEAIEGGIQRSNDVFMYLAPDDGYYKQIEISYKKDEKNWKRDEIVHFYYKSDKGDMYARVTLNFRTGNPGPKTGMTFTAYVNPNGSPNLEYDVFKAINLN